MEGILLAGFSTGLFEEMLHVCKSCHTEGEMKVPDTSDEELSRSCHQMIRWSSILIGIIAVLYSQGDNKD